MKRRYVEKILLPLIALLICGFIVLSERYGITTKPLRPSVLTDLTFSGEVEEIPTCVILTCKTDKVNAIYQQMITHVLDEMCIAYDVLDVTENFHPDCLSAYKTMVITFEDWSVLGDDLLAICNWVKQGGAMMNMSTPIPNEGFLTIAGKLGIENGGRSYTGISGFRIENQSMIGGNEGEVYSYISQGEAPLQISLNLNLREECTVHMSTEDGKTPLIWECPYQDGKFVIINETITEKYQRGFVCLAYSLLEDACIYPVINASAFYLDDFPAPMPEGDETYIKRDYGITLEAFYATIWWPEVLSWTEEYGIKYTGSIIETYNDMVEGPFERNYITTQYTSYGNMLLNNGGELGLHGYNHMPLTKEKGKNDSHIKGEKQWKSKEDMKEALEELYDFSTRLFPKTTFQIYVPSSNRLSQEGKEAVLEVCPDISIFASGYLESMEPDAYVQEFCVDEDGYIQTPRIVSGMEIENIQKIAALSELNYHYVQSHYVQLYDILDEQKGAVKGWEVLHKEFEKYLDWVYTSAPDIRNVTGSQMGRAVLQYDKLSVARSLEENALHVKIGGFSGEAYFILRVNDGTPVSFEGCEVKKITGNLYEVHAFSDEITIGLGEVN